MIDQLIQKIESEYLELRHPFPARDVATLGQSIPALRDTFHGELVIYWSNLAGIASRVRKLPLRLSADLAFDRTYVAQSFAEKFLNSTVWWTESSPVKLLRFSVTSSLMKAFAPNFCT